MDAAGDVLENIKFQFSNSDPGTRPTSDLIESLPATAYLIVLAIFGGGLAWLALADARSASARKESMDFVEQEAARMRAEGLDREASILESDIINESTTEAAAPKGLFGGRVADPDSLDAEEGNRFQRRQGRLANQRKKKGKKSRARPGGSTNKA